MKSWIEVNDGFGKKIWVDMLEARALVISGKFTNIQFDKDHYVAVTETPKQLLAAIGHVP